MKTIIISIICISVCLCSFSQKKESIKGVKIYSLEYNTYYMAPIDKSDIKKSQPLYLKTKNLDKILYSELNYYLNQLEEYKEDRKTLDYRGVLKVQYSTFKTRTYYIGNNFIEYKGKFYRTRKELLEAIYSFLPKDYY